MPRTKHLLLLTLCTFAFIGNQSQSQHISAPVQLSVDASKMIGKSDPTLWGNFGYDPIYKGTVLPELVPVWNMIKRTKGLHYIRCHNLFSDPFPGQRDRDIYGCRVYSEDSTGKPIYDWQYPESVRKFLKICFSQYHNLQITTW